jgi:hypothetical protein
MPLVLATRLVLVLLAALATGARAEGEPPAALQVPARIHDAGKVDRGTVVKHSFTLENRGPTPLSIDAKPG